MELLSHLNTLDMVPDGSTRKLPTLATTSAAGIVKPDGTSITVNEDGEISSPFERVITVKSYNYTTSTPDTYLIKVQSGTSDLTTDTNTLTFCY